MASQDRVRPQQSTPASAFIDLVGVRDLARERPQGYYENLDTFHRVLRDKAHRLKGNTSAIYVFSDSAFIEAGTFKDLAEFMSVLRSELLMEGLYFKASMRPGGLEQVEARETSREGRRILYGYSFGENAAALYGAQERLKGIGIIVDPSLRVTGSGDLVNCCFLPQMNSRRAEPYLDLKLATGDLNDGNLNRLLRSFLQAKSKSKKYGRFYISLLVLWVQSLDVSFLGDTDKDGGFVTLLLSGRFDAMFGDVLGIENVYMTFLGRLYHERHRIPVGLFHYALRFILTRKRLASSLENIPHELLSDESRTQFLNDFSSDLLKKVPGQEEVESLASQFASEGMSIHEIAVEFNRLKIPAPSAKRWSDEAVGRLLKR